MKYIIILLSFLIFSFQGLVFADNATVIVKPPDLVLEYFTSPLYLLPPTEASVEFKLRNPNEFDENLINISFSNFKFSGVSLPTLFLSNESKTFSSALFFEEMKDPDFYYYNYKNIANLLNTGTKLIVKGNFFGATIDYAYLPPNPKTKILNRTLSIIHSCNNDYHPFQLVNASGSLYICSDNCGESYEWRDAYYPEVDSISAFPKIVDGTKEAGITTSPIITSFVSDKNCYKDIYKAYLTAISPNGTKVVDNVEMSCSYYNFTTKKCVYELINCTELGNYSAEVRVVDNEGLEDKKSELNIFRGVDLQVSITKFYGNTTDFFIEGNAKILPENLDITNVLNLCYCGYPNPLYLGGRTEKCGIANNCSFLGPGKFKCYIRDLKLTDVLTSISFIITTNAFSINLSGYDRQEIDINGTINSVKIEPKKSFFNIFEPVKYTISFSNPGNIGWHGEVYNQTRISVYSLNNPSDRECYSVDYTDENSFVNLQSGKTGNFSYLGSSYFILGTYKDYLADLRYFWPEFNNNYGVPPLNFSIAKKDIPDLDYSVAAIDITEYELPGEVIRGDLVIGKAKAYFVGSMNFDYWELVQGFKYRATDKTSEGKFWVTKYNKTSKNEISELGSKAKKLNMEFNSATNFWEAEINTFNLSCDDEGTTHRVYFLINWTDYGIYTPYIKGYFEPRYWPYFYQDLKINCISRDFFEVNPETINLRLGEENKELWQTTVLNKEENQIEVDVLLLSKKYLDVINWLEFRGNTSFCGESCKKTSLILPGYTTPGILSGGSTLVHLIKATRTGNYELEFVVKEVSTGRELYRRKAWLNVYSEAIGSENIFFLILLFLFVVALNFKLNKREICK